MSSFANLFWLCGNEGGCTSASFFLQFVFVSNVFLIIYEQPWSCCMIVKGSWMVKTSVLGINKNTNDEGGVRDLTSNKNRLRWRAVWDFTSDDHKLQWRVAQTVLQITIDYKEGLCENLHRRGMVVKCCQCCLAMCLEMRVCDVMLQDAL